MNYFKQLLCLSALLLSVGSTAQVTLVKKHKPVSRIIVTTTEKSDSTAASLLQNFVERSTKAKLPIFTPQEVKKVKKGDILIGNGMSNKSLLTEKVKEDGFLLTTEDGILRIISGGDLGSVYGVTSLLERYLGIQYWGFKEYTLPTTDNVEIPKVNWLDNPTFSHRQTYFYGLEDPDYTLFSRIESTNKLIAGGYWCHTFSRFISPEKYGKTHPEYFAYCNGARRVGYDSQLCLTNPEVLEIVAQQIDSVFKAHPEQNMISVSQMDGHGTWCQCDKCKALSEKEGSLSGPYIHFMNKLAERFPDKQISTLSYLFTVEPPLHVKPLPNVNILLCNIDCKREVPLNENESGREFLKNLKGWGKISNNIFMWDYGCNFHNFPAPFPNLHILGRNMQIFHENNVQMVFEQIAGSIGLDFIELRTWLTSKLMWNPYQDTDELIKTFLNGYYGKASAPYLYQYIKLMEGALLASNLPLWIYDTPMTFKNTMLNSSLIKRYNELYDKAEEAAKNDSTSLARIQRSRTSLIYAELDINRTDPNINIEETSRKLEYFEKQCKRFGIGLLSEKRTFVDDFCKFYRERYLVEKKGNLALGAKVKYLIAPSPRYTNMAQTAMTDGMFGGQTFNQSWVGWEGTDGSFILDLGEEKSFTNIEMDLLQAGGDWIWAPKKIKYSISSDGENFNDAGQDDLVGKSFSGSFITVDHKLDKRQTARYIKFDIDGLIYRPGTDNKAWFFIDEIMVFDK